MKIHSKLIFSIVGAAAMGATSFAAVNPIGTWHGKITVNYASLKLPPQAESKRAMIIDQIKTGIGGTKLTLMIQAHGRYTQIASQAGQPTKHKVYGTWVLKGSRMTFHPAKPEGGQKDLVFSLSANGKVLTGPFPANPAGLTGKIIYAK